MKTLNRNLVDLPSRMLALGEELSAKAGDCWSMVGPAAPESDSERANDPYAIGAKRSWVPVLGEMVWEIPKSLEARAYYANVCRVSDGRKIGYVRVPDYGPNKDAITVFEDITSRFEETTAAMVFDQINNNGGSMFQMYALLELLTDRTLALPKHQITIDDDYAAMAADYIERARLGDDVSQERVEYSRFVLSEKAAGRGTGTNLSDPVYLEAVSEIRPAKIHYTKKIIVLINELTFSAGEFLAAILQDNKRATLFGQRTAGAGGCAKVIPALHNELLGIESIQLTWTIARRTNGEYIENQGVHPDIVCGETVEDIRHDHCDYRRTLLATTCG